MTELPPDVRAEAAAAVYELASVDTDDSSTFCHAVVDAVAEVLDDSNEIVLAKCDSIEADLVQAQAAVARVRAGAEALKAERDALQARVDELTAALEIIVEPGCYDSGTCTTRDPDPVTWCSSCIARAALKAENVTLRRRSIVDYMHTGPEIKVVFDDD